MNVGQEAVRYAGKALAVATLMSHAVLYMFELGQAIGYVLSTSRSLDLRAEAHGTQLVGLRVSAFG